MPARRLREPGPELRRLLRSRSGHGRDLAHVVAGLRRQHLRDVQRLGVGLRRGAADQGADPVRPGPRPRPARGRGHGAVLSAGAAHHPHANPRAGSPLPALPLHRAGGRSLSRARSWSRGPGRRRQIINTYGPTEASTDTSRQSLRPGEPVTIGSPFANVTYVILEVGELRPLPHGEVGELCIGGVHVARGYRNLPEQTAQKFITHPQFGRLYRTGDRCRIDIQTQRVHFLGRIDAQLKVRGHRVEAQAGRGHPPDAVQRDRGRCSGLPERGARRLRRRAVDLRRSDLGRRSGAGGVGRPGDGDPRQAASSAVGPDAASSWSRSSS